MLLDLNLNQIQLRIQSNPEDKSESNFRSVERPAVVRELDVASQEILFLSALNIGVKEDDEKWDGHSFPKMPSRNTHFQPYTLRA
jgi:hypothetical protein